MEQIQFDTGLREYRVGGGTLRFNPADPNLYARFLEAVEALSTLEVTDGISGLKDMDRQAKAILQTVFGPENDLDAVFGGMNLLAMGSNGHRVLENFLSALEPILTEGALRCAGN